MRKTLAVAQAVGNQALALCRSIDPDVTRHLLHMPLMSYTLFSSRQDKIIPLEPDGYRPLIFVHGLAGNRGDFLPMVGFLWIQGRRRTYRISFERGQTVRQMASSLVEYIQNVIEVTGEKEVDLIAHSLGGVISRVAVLDPKISARVNTLITLGAPHQGTYSARYANTPILRELRPQSDLMQWLSEQVWPENVRGISFWSQNDLLVVPAESSIVPGMKTVEMTPFTHYSYLIDPKSWAAVHQHLDEKEVYQGQYRDQQHL